MTTSVSSSEPGTTEPVPLRARGWGIPLLLTAMVALVLGGVAVAIVAATGGSGGKAETVTYVVPKGTAEELYLGKTINIMPPQVDLDVGDTLVIRNDDVQTATVGPFTVRAGETLTQTFRRPQTLIGECSLSGTGEVKIVVT